MNAKEKIKLGKVRRFARMASQAIDDLLSNRESLTPQEAATLEDVESVITVTVMRIERLDRAAEQLVALIERGGK